MKKHILLAVLCFGSCLAMAGEVANLIEDPGYESPKKWFTNAPAEFAAFREGERHGIVVKGKNPAQRYRKLSTRLRVLKPEDLANKKLTISFDAQIAKLSGVVEISIRQSNAKGLSIRYNTIRLTRYDRTGSWQHFAKTFSVEKNTTALDLHILSHFLQQDESVQISKLQITLK